LSVKNPNTPEADPLREPQEILEEMRKLDKEADEVLDKIEHLIV
jgi:type I restriction enzyme M protein